MPLDQSLVHEIPLKWVGPLRFSYPFEELIEVPLATYETTLWPSIARGAKISRLCGGIDVEVGYRGMSRSIAVETSCGRRILEIAKEFKERESFWHEVVASTSRFAKLIGVYTEIVGPILFLRLSFYTADAAGHNMSTKAAQAVLEKMLVYWPDLKYVTLSANLCSDKKVSTINALEGRGWHAQAFIKVSHEICLRHLHTTPEKIASLHVKKNLLGSTLAGSLRSSNAHYANMLLAFYLATGQDGANIVEGSQGITHAQVIDDHLHFSVLLPSLILGTTGHGKKRGKAFEHLEKLHCLPIEESPGESSRRLAAITAGVVLCGELSLMAALTCPGELMRAHSLFERS
jgi:hydroxymethylglutaryl-CoA reductase (NADPH)